MGGEVSGDRWLGRLRRRERKGLGPESGGMYPTRRSPKSFGRDAPESDADREKKPQRLRLRLHPHLHFTPRVRNRPASLASLARPPRPPKKTRRPHLSLGRSRTMRYRDLSKTRKVRQSSALSKTGAELLSMPSVEQVRKPVPKPRVVGCLALKPHTALTGDRTRLLRTVARVCFFTQGIRVAWVGTGETIALHVPLDLPIDPQPADPGHEELLKAQS